MFEVTKRELTRRRLLQGTAVIAAGSFLPKSVFAQTNPQPVPSGTLCPDHGTVTVTNVTTATIPAQFVGLSYEKSKLNKANPAFFTSSNTNLQALFMLLSGPSGGVLRIGGDSQDELTYGTDITSSQVWNLANFMNGTGAGTKWQVIYGINLKGQDLTSGQAGYTNTTLASEEVTTLQAALANERVTLLGLEMGNEPDVWGGNSNEGGGTYDGNPYNLSVYEGIWNTFRSAIPAVPNAATAGGASAYVPYNWQLPFVRDFVVPNNIPLAALTDHFYIGDGQSSPAPTVANLRDWNIPTATSCSNVPATPLSVTTFECGTGAVLQRISTQIKPGLPYRLSETNSYWDGGARGVSDAYVSALWVIDYMFAAAVYGASGVNFHGGNTGLYSPMFDVNGLVTVVNPIFHGMKFFNMALNQTTGTGTLLTTAITNVYGENVSAYCVQTSSTTATVLLINKSGEYYFEPTITLPFKCTQATLVELTTNGSAGLGTLNFDGSNYSNYEPAVFIQNAYITTSGAFSATNAPYNLATPIISGNNSTVTCYLPTISAVLISVTF